MEIRVRWSRSQEDVVKQVIESSLVEGEKEGMLSLAQRTHRPSCH